MAKVAIDCDGVLADFGEAFIHILHNIYPGHPFTADKWTTWNYGGMVSEEESEAVWKAINATDNFWLTLNAYSENVGALAQWLISHTGQDVWIVTSRSETAGGTIAWQTETWLKACGLNPVHNYLGVIPVANSSNKAGVYRAAGIEWSIDDKAETVEQCDRMKGDHRAYLLDRPWNQDAKVERRVTSVAEFLKDIK